MKGLLIFFKDCSMELYKTKTYVLEDEVPKELTPHDFMGIQKNHQLRIQSDWYDIESQHGDNSVFEGRLLLVACFFFKCEKTLHSKDIDFLTRYIITITEDIVHNKNSSISGIYTVKRLSSNFIDCLITESVSIAFRPASAIFNTSSRSGVMAICSRLVIQDFVILFG